MEQYKMGKGITIFIIVSLIIFGYLIFCSYTRESIDDGCKKLGYEKYIEELEACIDINGKLHFVEFEGYNPYKLDFQLPYQKINMIEYKEENENTI